MSSINNGGSTAASAAASDLVGYPATITMAHHKRYAKRTTRYDKSHLDMAVDLVIKNKLSMRAASHIYKIPFSTLRTRKVFLTSGMTASEYAKLSKQQQGNKEKKRFSASMVDTTNTTGASLNNGNRLNITCAAGGGGGGMIDDLGADMDDLDDENYGGGDGEFDEESYEDINGIVDDLIEHDDVDDDGENFNEENDDDNIVMNDDEEYIEEAPPTNLFKKSESTRNNNHQQNGSSVASLSLANLNRPNNLNNVNGGANNTNNNINTVQSKKPPTLLLSNVNNSNITNGNHTYNNNNTTTNNNIQQPPQKRLYIKHGQLDTIINTKIIPKTTAVVSAAAAAAAASVTANKPNTMPHLVRQSPPSLGYNNNNSNNDNKPSSRPSPGQVNGRGVLVVQPNQFKTTSASTAAVQNGAAKNGGAGVVQLQKPAVASQQTNQNFKLSSILSATTLSMNKNKPFSMSISPAPASKPSSIIQQSTTTQFNKSIPNNQQQKPITTNIVKAAQANKLAASERTQSSSSAASSSAIVDSIANSEFLSRITTTTTKETVKTENPNELHKCKGCNLMFLNAYFLQQHFNAKPTHQTPTNARKDDRVVYVDSLDANKHFTCSFCSLTTLDKISFLAHVSLCSSSQY